MVRRKLTIPERRQAVGMHIGGFSHRRVADHFSVNHSIIVRLMQPLPPLKPMVQSRRGVTPILEVRGHLMTVAISKFIRLGMPLLPLKLMA
jgi:hypothetical protein